MSRAYLVAMMFVPIWTVGVFAADDSKQQGTQFQQRKQDVLSDIDARLANLQSFRSCAADTQDHEGLKACQKQHEAQAKAARKAGIDQRIQRLQEEKARLEQEKKPQ